MPAHAGRLRPLERCVFTLVFALMIGFVVLVAFSATTRSGHLLLAGSPGKSTVAAGLGQEQSRQGSASRGGLSGHARSSRTASRGDSTAARQEDAAVKRHLDMRLAAALRPVLGGDPGRLAVGVIDLTTGAAATYDAGVAIRAGGVVSTDILAALLLQHQQAGTPISDSEADLAADMIKNGSYSATTELWGMVGGTDGMNAANANLKLHDTAPVLGGDWSRTKTTVTDQLQLLTDLVGPRSPLLPAARDYELGLMADVASGQRWGVPAAASTGTGAVVKDGSLAGPMWIVGSVGVIQRHGQDLLVVVLSDRNPSEGPAVTAVQAAALAAAQVVAG